MKNRNREYIRRAKKHGVEWAMFDTIAEVFDRDEWVCQICGEDTNLDASWPDKDFPSLDHIIPMSAGGTHTPSNCQTSHLHCNLSKAHKSDKAMAAKVKRMSGEKGQFARRKKNGSKIQSRGFQKPPEGFKHSWPSQSLNRRKKT
jgi:5-methylcytosine-specific restriction endonuclease McrA